MFQEQSHELRRLQNKHGIKEKNASDKGEATKKRNHGAYLSASEAKITKMTKKIQE